MQVVIGIFMIIFLVLGALAFIVIATVTASDGEAWKYPHTSDLF